LAAIAAKQPPIEDESGPDEDGSVPHVKSKARKKAPGLGDFIDPGALPRDETLAKYWSTATGAVYRESDGIRFVNRVNHVE
jgi:hypothetical protein